ncbi:MAG: tRNA threonylcarbamoyladenosine dehydratase [Sandaracinus sp.]|nr:tRNA threonylcarbamoyladenosine dehydratase [Myxococcales bacterium]MAT26404.1 tRNA threonylcarbamoyladenosine dehydratase [Sandaracinus sp.]MBJ73107.1 tRNA threonylcarbamoyladenosine dehydratase [Sandaracinus sp.]
MNAPAPAEADARTDEATDARAPETPYRTHRRFDRAARLFTEPGLHRLMGARVRVFGVGGVGSFTAEALARSGVGHLDLVDFDRVCITNTNRQLHAMKGTVGKAKVEVMAERLRLVHPTATVEPVAEFYSAAASERLLAPELDFVVDAIDNLTAKAHLIATCVRRGIPLVSSMGAAARMDPTAIEVADLARTRKDPFARALRKILRKQHGFDFTEPAGVPAVFSTEEPIEPSAPSYDEGVGFRCVCPGGKNGMHDCDRRARIDGSASFVTGAFGLAAASVVVRRLTGAR